MTKLLNSYDLEERTAKFGEAVILFVRSLKNDNINNPLVNQVVRSATSIGANYMEANGASSKRDFRNKIYFCKKETQETKHWLRMLAKANSDKVGQCRHLWEEANELSLIFGKITSTLSKK